MRGALKSMKQIDRSFSDGKLRVPKVGLFAMEGRREDLAAGDGSITSIRKCCRMNQIGRAHV